MAIQNYDVNDLSRLVMKKMRRVKMPQMKKPRPRRKWITVTRTTWRIIMLQITMVVTMAEETKLSSNNLNLCRRSSSLL